MTFLYLASVPCVIPVTVIQKYEQSMYCFTLGHAEWFIDERSVCLLHNDYQRRWENVCFIPKVRLSLAV